MDSREVKHMWMKERPLIMMMLQNSAHIIYLNEADAYPEDEKPKDVIKLFIRFSYKGIVLKSWSARPIACFVRGRKQARVEPILGHDIRNVQMLLWSREGLH